MADQRPDPERLLAEITAEEEQQARGQLKIFFGAAPGVGKTYAMLEAGRKAAKEGMDVLVGYLEPHVRPETQAMVLGLDMLARREVEYRGARLIEFDLEAALKAHPKLILVDELAHTNAPGLMHVKRWQDVVSLLDAGIDVYTTLNVQHLESVNDIVAQITGVTVRETVPDAIFERASEVELVDLAPDDLIERLREGKVYLPEQAGRAIESFFKKGNLIALRELALRRMADRVNAQMERYRAAQAGMRTWPTSERLLVSVTSSPHSARLVRAASRMATSLRATWEAVHVETPAEAHIPDADRERIAQTLHLAEELGAQTATLVGSHAVDELLAYARRRNVSKIIVGKTDRSRFRELLNGSFVYELTRKCGDIDVYVISGDVETGRRPPIRTTVSPSGGVGYLVAMAVVVLCSVAGYFMQKHFALANIIMVYLLGTVAVAMRFGRGPSILTSLLGVAAFDFFFVPPSLTFAVSDSEYLVTFAVMLITGLVIGTLTSQVRFQAERARQRESRTAALYAMSRQLVKIADRAQLVEQADSYIGNVFDADVFLLFPDPASHGPVTLVPHPQAHPYTPLADRDLAVAQWVFENGERAGRGTDTLPSASTLFLPLHARSTIVGILGVRPRPAHAPLPSSDQLRLLETFAGQIALAEERIRSADEAQKARLQTESERLRNSLLSAVSHDLRTPLAAIAGASSALVDADGRLTPEARRELAESIYEESGRLNRLVANLLDMTRLEASALSVRKEWQPLEEVVGAVLHRLGPRLQQHDLVARIDRRLPLVPLDALLIQQVLVNLIENALKYTPPGTTVELSARAEGDHVVVELTDHGPGIPAGDEQKIFEKFYRRSSAGSPSGVGLGLAICRGIVELHGGKIEAHNRPGGGAVFRFTLPLEGQPPAIPAEEEAA